MDDWRDVGEEALDTIGADGRVRSDGELIGAVFDASPKRSSSRGRGATAIE